MSLIGVCWTWKNIVYATSVLWCHLWIQTKGSVSHHVKTLETYLTRSDQSPLTIHFSYVEVTTLPLVVSRYLDLLVKQCTRWHDVEFCGVPQTYAHYFDACAIKGSIPCLRRLALRDCFQLDPAVTNASTIDVFSTAPHLTCLTLQNSCPTQFTVPWSQISLLILEWYYITTPEELGDILASAVNMTDLHCAIPSTRPELVVSNVQLRYARLKRLHLYDFGPLWHSVSCPSLQSLFVERMFDIVQFSLLCSYLRRTPLVIQLTLGYLLFRHAIPISLLVEGARNIKSLRLRFFPRLSLLFSHLTVPAPDQQQDSCFLPLLEELTILLDEDGLIFEDALICMLQSRQNVALAGGSVSKVTSLSIYYGPWITQRELSAFRGRLTGAVDGEMRLTLEIWPDMVKRYLPSATVWHRMAENL